MVRRLHVVIALLVWGPACARMPDRTPAVSVTGEKTAAFRGDSELVQTILDAARAEGIPGDVLLAIAFAESRFESQTGRLPPGAHEADDPAGYDGPLGCGVFGLDPGPARTEAARLAGSTEAALCFDASLEARAAARRLRALAAAGGARAPRSTDVTGWLAVADRWHPALAADGFPYQRYLRGVLARGIRMADPGGDSIRIPALVELEPAVTLPDGVGRAGAYATPDTPLADWQGPACDYQAASRTMGDVDYVVIHTCEGGFTGCVNYLRDCGGGTVSAHYVTSYAGMTVQLVEEHDIGWHVGCLNSTSIGIEHEGFAGAMTHPDEQYCQTAMVVRSICDRWGIPCDRAHVIGHVEANEMFCHGSHWDPGPDWDWTTFMDYVARGGCTCTPDAPELCNGRDDDCNGMVDEDAGCPVCEVIPAGGRIVEENELCFAALGPEASWRDVAAGHGGSLKWTHTTDWADPANYGVWTLDFAAAGEYLLCAYSLPEYGESTRAVYQVTHAGMRDDVTLDQSGAEGWREIGRFGFAAGAAQTVRVDDNTGESLDTMTRLVVDALKVLPASASGCDAEPGMVMPDAGPGVGTDGGPPVAIDGGTTGGDAGPGRPREMVDGSCGCATPGGRSWGGGAAAACALALGLWVSRRRGARRLRRSGPPARR